MAYERGLTPFSLHLLRPFSHSMKMAKRSGPQVSDDKAPFFLVALSVVLFFPSVLPPPPSLLVSLLGGREEGVCQH